jgi:hypothetical protein
MYKLHSHWMDFCDIWHWRLLFKICWGNTKIGYNWTKNTRHLMWRAMYVCSFDSSTIYFGAWQCKGNPLLHFHGNTQQFYIVSWELTVTKGMHCWAVTSVDSDMQPNITQDAGCSSAVTVVTQTHHTLVLYIHCPSCHQYSIKLTINKYIYTGCFTTLGHNCRRWFPRSPWSKKFI